MRGAGKRTISARHRPRQPLLLALLFVLLIAASASWAADDLAPAPTLADSQEPFFHTEAVVVASDRFVCSLLSDEKSQAHVLGQDGTDSVVVDGVAYWAFGDTLLAGGWLIPNMLGYTTDLEASDCIDLTPATTPNGVATSLLSTVPGELTVWPLALEPTGPNRVHVFYASVVSDGEEGWRVAGGIASFDTDTLVAERALDGALIWPDGMPLPTGTVADGGYVYVFLVDSRAYLATDVLLARVPMDSIESPASYEYWHSTASGQPGVWLTGLWDEAKGAWGPAIDTLGELWRQPGLLNGVEVEYNEFLGKWVAVYAANYLSTINVRAADELTGPWDGPQSTVIDCGAFHGEGAGYTCYTGEQHRQYQRDDGRTIYVTYSNAATSQVYLHEIRFAAPAVQSSDAAGNAVYLSSGTAAPPGYVDEGVAFYASDIPIPGFAPIHRWINNATGASEYGASAPFPAFAYSDGGLAFYAPIDPAPTPATNVEYAPVFRWSKGQAVRYSALDLAPAGYVQGNPAFYTPCPDTDGDSLTDCEESFLRTDSFSSDTDGDGISDSLERVTPGCDPLVFNDDDLDGLGVEEEVFAGLNPCLWDTGGWGCVHAELRVAGCDIDSDGDGCRDAWELGPDPRLGGQRDPNWYWDFYNVPDSWNRRDDAVDSLQDILAIIRRYGANDSNGTALINRNTDPLSTPPEAGYHPVFDRARALPGDQAWQLQAPDGVITLSDVFGLLVQMGHTCRESDV